MRYNTFLRIKRKFPAERGEGIADYFGRLAKFLEENEKGLKNGKTY